MMKTFFSRFFLIASVSVMIAGAFASCDKKDPSGKDDSPKLVLKPEADTIYIDGDYPVPHPDVPMDIYNGKLETTPDGVSVEVVEVTEDNFKFVCRPGANVASYRIDVFPLAILYNDILDNGAFGKDKRTVENLIIGSLFDTSGNGGYQIDPGNFGEDYYEMTYDWANLSYSQQDIVPGCQYIIAIGACYDSSASEAALSELDLIYVETLKKPLGAEPVVQIDVRTTYVGAQITNLPDENTSGVYFYCTDKDMVDAYVNAFGDRMLCDFLRHAYIPNAPVPASDKELLTYQIGPWTNISPTHEFTALALGCDADLTPASVYTRHDFTLDEKPTDREDATLTYAVEPEMLGASYLELAVELGKECRNGYHLLLKVDEANYEGYLQSGRYYMEGDASVKTQLRDHIAKEGYAIKNVRFSFNEQTESPDGEAFNTIWPEYTISPDTEYVIAYCGMNAFRELTEVFFSEPFRTLPRVTDRPLDNKSGALLSFEDLTPSGAKFVVTYDPDNTANVWFVNTSMNGESPLSYTAPAENASRQEWLDFFFGFGEHSIYINQWWRNDSGRETFTFAGLDPASTFRYAYIAEDMDGVLSDVMFAEFTTTSMTAGPDPTIDIRAEYNESDGTWSVWFVNVKDASSFRYLVECSDYLYLDRLPDSPGGTAGMRAFEFYDYWYNYVGTLGLEDSDGYHSYAEVTDPEKAGIDHLAACVAFGLNTDGTQAISKLFYLLLPGDGSQPRKLSWYFPSYVEK